MIVVTSCPLCGGGRSRPYYRYGAFGPPHRVRILNRLCRDCGLIFQSPRMSPAELERYYANYVSDTQPTIASIPPWLDNLNRGVARTRLANLRPFLRDGMRVLDIGCGYGALMAVLRDESGRRLELLGINPEHSMAELGRRRYGLDIRVGMFESVDLPAGGFDLIIMDNVIEHLDAPKASVAAIRELLAEDGVFFVVTNSASRPHGFLWQNFFHDHTVTFSPRTLAALLENGGFRMEMMDEHGHVNRHDYHYPYVSAIARRTTRPAAEDYSALADHADEMDAFSRRYLRDTYRRDGLRKRLYEWAVTEGLQRPAARGVLHIARVAGLDLSYRVTPHTPPPADTIARWVFAGFGDTYADGAKTIALSDAAELQAEYFLFRSRDDGSYFTALAPAGIERREFPSGQAATDWVCAGAGKSSRPDMVVSFRLHDAPDFPPELPRMLADFAVGKDERLSWRGPSMDLMALRGGALRSAAADGVAP